MIIIHYVINEIIKKSSENLILDNINLEEMYNIYDGFSTTQYMFS